MTSLLGELHAGRLRWDLLEPFPAQPSADRAAGQAARVALARVLAHGLDPDRVDTERVLPARLTAQLAAAGLLRLTGPVETGGRGLSPLAVFQLLTSAGGESTAVGMLLAWHNVLGVAAYRELLPPGPLPELVDEGLASGAVFGLGDSEPGGAAHAGRQTVAVPTEDGRGYLLTGEKLFVGNGSNADLLTITATVRDRSGERIDLFLVDTHSAGCTVAAVQELTGLAGSPLAALRLAQVYVPAERVLTTAAGGWRSSPQVQRLNAFARMAITVTQTLGPARRCLDWTRDFLARRQDMNGRPLAEYEAVAHRVAAAVADVYAVDSVVQWCLLAGPGQDRLPELTAAKNIGTMTSWRVIDETVSLLGGEGVETAGSKRRRGVPPLPVERALRDARCLRVAGGVDFNIDLRAGWSGIFAPRYADPAPTGGADAGRLPAALRERLSPANRRTADYLSGQVSRLWTQCGRLVTAFPAAALQERQELLIAANRIADELFTMAVVLARAAHPIDGAADAQRLARVYCAGARRRLADHWYVLATAEPVEHRSISRAWLTGALDRLVDDPLLERGQRPVAR